MTSRRPVLPGVVALTLALSALPSGRAQEPPPAGAGALGPPVSIGLRGALEGESGVNGPRTGPLTLTGPGRAAR